MNTYKRKKNCALRPLFRYGENGELDVLKSPAHDHLTAHDIKHAVSFVRLYAGSPKTYVSYCKEIERLLLWCEHQSCTSLKQISVQHLKAYETFLREPKPRSYWSHADSARREARFARDGSVNEGWRPFSGGGLSSNSIRKSITIVDRFFRQLAYDGYIKRDPRPPGLRRVMSDYSFNQSVNQRYVPRELIELTLKTLESSGTSDADFYVTRARYLVLLLFYTGLRINEVVKHTMAKYTQVENEWFLDVIGKGNKRRRIPIPDEFIDALVKYRTMLGLSRFPSARDNTPLAPDETLNKSIGVRRLDQIIHDVFGRAAATLGDTDPNSDLLRRVSAHWLRHSYGTYLARAGVPLHNIKENLGHSSLQTTTVYIEAGDQERHRNTRGLSLRVPHKSSRRR